MLLLLMRRRGLNLYLLHLLMLRSYDQQLRMMLLLVMLTRGNLNGSLWNMLMRLLMLLSDVMLVLLLLMLLLLLPLRIVIRSHYDGASSGNGSRSSHRHRPAALLSFFRQISTHVFSVHSFLLFPLFLR